ncbi:hypothetical protein Trydic_g15243 [Trypoxylus dichotomus]
MKRIGIIIALCPTVFAWVLYDLSVGDKCGPNNERVCVLVRDCLEALLDLRKRRFHDVERCGFQGKTEIVCCKRPKFEPVTRTAAATACEKYSKLSRESLSVIGGRNSSLRDFPYIASLHIKGDEPEQTVWGDCAGSLISETFVVTAAHCVVRVDNKDVDMVRLGKVDLLGDADGTLPQNIRIQEVIVHPGYKHTEKLNDIALLRLAKPAEFTENVKPVCLNTNPDIQGPLTVAGWGFVNVTTEETSRFLQKAFVSPYALNKCNETYLNSPRPKTILPTHLCALSLDKTRQDTCQGDSGGPLQITNGTTQLLVGITSYGRSCAGRTPSVYTRISNFIDWIEPIVWP